MARQRTPEEWAAERLRRSEAIARAAGVDNQVVRSGEPNNRVIKVPNRQEWLKQRLNAYRMEYLDLARRDPQPTSELRRIDAEREPLFAELAALEAHHPSSDAWLPVRHTGEPIPRRAAAR